MEAREVFPGGDTRSSAHFPPYPLSVDRAEGAYLVDADGHRLLDCMDNVTSLIHGHAHPAIGGGLPIGGLGGKQELMQRFHPDQPRPVMDASTFSGNPISMAAGLAALLHFDSEQRARIDELGERLRSGFNNAFRDTGIRGQAIGL